jgi:SecD/SecF fusion protein
VGILIFGTAQLWNFAAAMGIGVVVVTISTTYVATSFIIWSEYWWNMRNHRKKAKNLTEANA